MADLEAAGDPIADNLNAQLQEVQEAIVNIWNQSDAMGHASADRLAAFRELCESQLAILATIHDRAVFIQSQLAADAEKTG